MCKLRRQRTTDAVAAVPGRLGAAAQQVLVACLRQQPNATLNELRLWLAAVSRATLERRSGWTGVVKKALARRQARY